MVSEGFKGVRVRQVAEWTEVQHTIKIAVYRFPDGTERLCVEAHEDHGPPGGAGLGIWPLPETVHLLQNVTQAEFFAISEREPQ